MGSGAAVVDVKTFGTGAVTVPLPIREGTVAVSGGGSTEHTVLFKEHARGVSTGVSTEQAVGFLKGVGIANESGDAERSGDVNRSCEGVEIEQGARASELNRGEGAEIKQGEGVEAEQGEGVEIEQDEGAAIEQGPMTSESNGSTGTGTLDSK